MNLVFESSTGRLTCKYCRTIAGRRAYSNNVYLLTQLKVMELKPVFMTYGARTTILVESRAVNISMSAIPPSHHYLKPMLASVPTSSIAALRETPFFGASVAGSSSSAVPRPGFVPPSSSSSGMSSMGQFGSGTPSMASFGYVPSPMAPPGSIMSSMVSPGYGMPPMGPPGSVASSVMSGSGSMPPLQPIPGKAPTARRKRAKSTQVRDSSMLQSMLDYGNERAPSYAGQASELSQESRDINAGLAERGMFIFCNGWNIL